jgi:hypothetical protein
MWEVRDLLKLATPVSDSSLLISCFFRLLMVARRHEQASLAAMRHNERFLP